MIDEERLRKGARTRVEAMEQLVREGDLAGVMVHLIRDATTGPGWVRIQLLLEEDESAVLTVDTEGAAIHVGCYGTWVHEDLSKTAADALRDVLGIAYDPIRG